MKRIIVFISCVILSLMLVACTSFSKVKEVDNIEYAKNMAIAFNSMKLSSESSPLIKLNGSGDKYVIECLKETLKINDDFVKSISSFNSSDPKIAEFHNHYIEFNLEHQRVTKEYIKLLEQGSYSNDDLALMQQNFGDSILNMTEMFYLLSEMFYSKTGMDLTDIAY